MSATMTLKHKVARRSASAINLIQHSLLILGLAFALGLINLIPGGAQPIDLFKIKAKDKGNPLHAARLAAYGALVVTQQRAGLYAMPCAAARKEVVMT